MPQHEMPFDGNDDAKAFKALDYFTQGYVQAIFFTECHSDTPDLQDATFADMAPATLADIVADCTAFQQENATALDAACATDRYNSEQAGIDFWLTRNRHGAGYWDRGLAEAGKTLTDAAHAAGSCDLYLGDDGKLHLS